MNRRLILSLLLFPCFAAGVAFADEAATTKPEPFAFGDFTWMPGGYAPTEASPLATKYFVPELRLDSVYHSSSPHPSDHTITGSSEAFRSDEFQTTQVGVGGDFNYNNVALRFMTQFGMYSTTTARNDASPSRGQWSMADAYRYVSEAYASYHIDALNGINIQSGIFMSYVGLWSYYNFDNWTYQPSYVSSNTPWFFNGVRAQIYVSDRLKIEPWLINGWQSYGMFNQQPGVGVQIAYRPTDRWAFVGNQYYGADTLNTAGRKRMHTDDSAMWKYYQGTGSGISKAAVSLTMDAGCEEGAGVNCSNQYFLGFMAYHRVWFANDRYAVTFGGGAINNPGRYLVLLPPINGANAASGTPYFTQNPGDNYHAWDAQLTGDYMPTRNVTFRLEFNHRAADVPYFSGEGGVTPPGGNQGTPGSQVTGWSPDLSKYEDRVTAAMMIRL